MRHRGLETHVRELSVRLSLKGHLVTVYGRKGHRFATVDEQCLVGSGVESKDVFCPAGKFTATVCNSLWSTASALRQRRYNILHYHGVGCAIALLLARVICRSPIVLTLHSTNWEETKWSALSGWLIRQLEKAAVRYADAVITVGETIGARTTNEYGVLSDVISPGTGTHLQRDQSNDDELLKSFGLEKGSYILFVGRVTADKGCHVLVDAFIKAKLPVKLVLAGPVQSEAYYTELTGMADQRLVMPGIQSDSAIGALYRWCCAFCTPSTTEALPISLLDALSHGALCAVSDIPGHSQLGSVTRFPPGDAEALSLVLREMYAQSLLTDIENRWRKGISWLEQNPQYGFDHVVGQVVSVYERIIGSARYRRQ